MVAQGSECNLFSIFSIILFAPNWLIKDTRDICILTAVSDLCRGYEPQDSSNNMKVLCQDLGKKEKDVSKTTFEVGEGFNLTVQSPLYVYIYKSHFSQHPLCL